MKTRNLILPMSICICVVIFAACKKTDNGTSLSPQERALTGKIWKIQSLTVPKTGDATGDSSIIEPCADSALLGFDIYGNFQFADGSKHGCDSSSVPYDIGGWALSNSNDSMLLQGKKRFIWKLETLNDTIIKATFRDSVSPTKSVLKKIVLK